MQNVFRKTAKLMAVHGWQLHPVLKLMPFGRHAPEKFLNVQELVRVTIDDQRKQSERIDALKKIASEETDLSFIKDSNTFVLDVVTILKLTVKHLLIDEVRIRYLLLEEGIRIVDRQEGRLGRFCAAKFMRGSTQLSSLSYAHVNTARHIGELVHGLESMSGEELANLDNDAAVIAIRMIFLHVQCLASQDKNDGQSGGTRDYMCGVGQNLWQALNQCVTEAAKLEIREYENRYGLAAFNQVMHRLPMPSPQISPSLHCESESTTSKVADGHDEFDSTDAPSPIFSADLLVIKQSIPPATSSEDQQMIKRYSALCQPSPVAIMPSVTWLETRRIALLAEFPWASAVIDRVFDDLVTRRKFGAVEISTQPILLMGPAGVGKSRLARRIAEELTLPFLPISMAGVDDSRTILGTARGWSSGQPSALLELMLKRKSASGMILLDEIEKSTNRSVNSPSTTSALLPLLELETASRWFDSFLQVPCNLSRLNFIATANSIVGISRPLLSRFHVVHMSAPKPDQLMGAIPHVISDIAQEWRVPRDVLPNLMQGDLIGTPGNMREMRALVTASLRTWAKRHLGPGNLH